MKTTCNRSFSMEEDGFVGELSGIYKFLAGFAVKEDRAAAEDARRYVIAWLDRWAKGEL